MFLISQYLLQPLFVQKSKLNVFPHKKKNWTNLKSNIPEVLFPSSSKRYERSECDSSVADGMSSVKDGPFGVGLQSWEEGGLTDSEAFISEG